MTGEAGGDGPGRPGGPGTGAPAAGQSGRPGPGLEEWARAARRLGDANGCVYIWDVTTQRVVKTLADRGSVGGVAFNPDGAQIASGDADGNIYLSDAALP